VIGIFTALLQSRYLNWFLKLLTDNQNPFDLPGQGKGLLTVRKNYFTNSTALFNASWIPPHFPPAVAKKGWPPPPPCMYFPNSRTTCLHLIFFYPQLVLWDKLSIGLSSSAVAKTKNILVLISQIISQIFSSFRVKIHTARNCTPFISWICCVNSVLIFSLSLINCSTVFLILFLYWHYRFNNILRVFKAT
jgi:hypothetical protein